MASQQVEKAGAAFGQGFVAEGFCEVVFEEVAREAKAIEDFGVGDGALAEEALGKRQEFGGPFACALGADCATGTGVVSDLPTTMSGLRFLIEYTLND